MIILLLFAFLAGIVTILSPCILPVLPIILAGSVTGDHRRPLSIVAGFIISFTVFTLFLSTIVKTTGIPVDTLRFVAIAIIAILGLSMIANIELFKIAFIPKTTNGFLLGMSLGLVWAPCVGPILASVIALAATGTVTGQSSAITLAYSLGTAIPMFVILYGGKRFIPTTPAIGKIFGVLMIVVAAAMFVNLDRKFETWILTVFPNYGAGLTKIESTAVVQKQLTTMGTAPELTGGQTWFNSSPLTLAGLKGKVVMVDFWTYTCINCIRTLPYTKAWYEKYKDKGFVLIGVHTPEFEFEKNTDNVHKAIADFGITYPVVQDNEYAIWNAYNNQYWPADYLISKEGNIVDTHFGEGDYDATEKKIQELLSIQMPINNPESQIHTQTPETYIGTDRLGALSSPERPVAGLLQNYTVPNPVPYNTFAFGGSWTESTDRAMPAGSVLGAAQLMYHFDATNVYLVMRPKTKGIPGNVQVLLDGNVVGADDAGADVVNGVVMVDTDRLYHLIKLSTQGEHMLQLKFLDPNLELYAFTFG
jgi:cytochrome c biogenesis protein CcdA/thiol-disulfide isomerase/thioredoxin